MTETVRTWLEPFINRLLWVSPAPAPTPSAKSAERAERAFGASLIFSGVRCILQYVVLPFILPLIGIAADTAVPILLAINVLAAVLIVSSLRRFWQIDYKYKWQYLPVAITALLLLVAFTMYDLNGMTR